MKRRLFALFITLMMIFAFATTCLAASSPVATAAPTDNEKTTGDGSGKADTHLDGKKNLSDVSPKTGYPTEIAFFAMLTALGTVIVSTKKCAE